MHLREIVTQLDTKPKLPGGSLERFNGYGVMGLPFKSGHVLALRHFPASSVGPGYSSVWHRTPEGEWDFYADVAPHLSCTRFFGSAVAKAIQSPVHITWLGPQAFRVKADAAALEWEVNLTTTRATTFLNLLGSLLPAPAWKNTKVLRLMEKIATSTLRAGSLSLYGTAPNGQRFIANPRSIWLVSESTATLNGESLGPVGALEEQASVGDFWIPQRGLFALGQAYFEPFNPSLHHLITHIQTVSNE
jgi:hypothetical protein